MYTAMINKDKPTLERVHDDSFILVHMTGMRQTKTGYIEAIMDGTLNYYAAEHEEARFAVNGDTAALTGKSRVTAAVNTLGNCSLNFSFRKKTASGISRSRRLRHIEV